MVLLCGASASGKTEIVNRMVQMYGYLKFTTTTTRPKRPHEINGVDYHFMNEATFKALQRKDAFIETTSYHGHLYGTKESHIAPFMLAILDPNGINAFYTQRPGRDFIVFITADKAIRAKRLLHRGDDRVSLQARLIQDDATFNKANLLHCDLHLVNNDASLDALCHTVHTHYQQFLKDLP